MVNRLPSRSRWTSKKLLLLLAAVAGRGTVQPLAKFLAGAEERYALFFHGNCCPRPRIAPLACGTHFDGERAKAAQFNTISGRQGAGNFVEHSRDDALDIAVVEMRVALSQARHQF